MEVETLVKVLALDTYEYDAFTTNEGDRRQGGTVYKVHCMPESGGVPSELRTDAETFMALQGCEGKTVAVRLRLQPKTRIVASTPVATK